MSVYIQVGLRFMIWTKNCSLAHLSRCPDGSMVQVFLGTFSWYIQHCFIVQLAYI